MRVIILGAGAGGGLPQWNCNCPVCRRARSREGGVKPRTQSSIAISRDGETWALVNASPDLRQQIERTPALHPHADAGPRHSPIRSVVLTNADVDHIGGLLTLRERQPLALFATARVLKVLAANSIFSVLAEDVVERRALALDTRTEVLPGLTIEPFSVPGKVALFLEEGTPELGAVGEDTIGLRIAEEGGEACYFVPGCAALPDWLAKRLAGASLLLFDGTLWRDDEMIETGTGVKTGARMGHMSLSGREGSLTAFANLGIHRKVFVHLNNTNPVLIEDSPERTDAEEAGWEIGYDGMEIRL